MISGLMGARVGTQERVLQPGQAVRIAAGLPHTWWNAGSGHVVVEGWMDPAADLDLFMKEITKAMNSTRSGRPPLTEAAVILDRYPDASVPESVSRPIRAVVLPVALAFARLTGKHRAV